MVPCVLQSYIVKCVALLSGKLEKFTFASNLVESHQCMQCIAMMAVYSASIIDTCYANAHLQHSTSTLITNHDLLCDGAPGASHSASLPPSQFLIQMRCQVEPSQICVQVRRDQLSLHLDIGT